MYSAEAGACGQGLTVASVTRGRGEMMPHPHLRLILGVHSHELGYALVEISRINAASRTGHHRLMVQGSFISFQPSLLYFDRRR